MKQKALIFIIVILLSFTAHLTFGETLSSTNYNIENPSIDVGGEASNSANYAERESVGDTNADKSNSTNYNVFPGFVQHAYPGVPGSPTLTNTGGTLYNSLDFVITTGGNTTDTNYAIAISPDNFVTTYFIQIDDSVNTTPAWQDYTGWGSGTGERVTGLVSGTTYKIKVNARFGINTETAYSITASAATSNPSMTITFTGVNSGTSVAGETTTVTSTTNAISYGSLLINSPAVAAHTVTVSTNAISGYTTTLRQDGDLRTGAGQIISTVVATNASPAAWPGGITNGRFGYHTTDNSLCTGTTNRFNSNNTYAALSSTPEEVACNNAPVSGESTTVVYKLEIGNLQEAGNYQNILTYISTAQF